MVTDLLSYTDFYFLHPDLEFSFRSLHFLIFPYFKKEEIQIIIAIFISATKSSVKKGQSLIIQT